MSNYITTTPNHVNGLLITPQWVMILFTSWWKAFFVCLFSASKKGKKSRIYLHFFSSFNFSMFIKAILLFCSFIHSLFTPVVRALFQVFTSRWKIHTKKALSRPFTGGGGFSLLGIDTLSRKKEEKNKTHKDVHNNNKKKDIFIKVLSVKTFTAWLTKRKERKKEEK